MQCPKAIAKEGKKDQGRDSSKQAGWPVDIEL